MRKNRIQPKSEVGSVIANGVTTQRDRETGAIPISGNSLSRLWLEQFPGAHGEADQS